MVNSKRIIFLLIYVILIANLNACSSGGEGSVTDGPSTGVPPPSPPPDDGGDDPPREVVNTGMYIRLSESSLDLFASSYMSEGGTFGADCFIPLAEINKDIECVFDLLEEDMYFYGYGLEVNIPDDLCDFATFKPYWYYNQEVGMGPGSITLNVTRDADDEVTNYSCTVDGLTVDDCLGFPEVNVNKSDDTLTCVYDRSRLTSGENCCFGDYSLTTNLTTIDEEGNSDVSPPNVIESHWTGNWGSCIGGSVLGGWPYFSSDGLPQSEIFDVRNGGRNRVYSFTSNIDGVNNTNNYYLANYYDKSGVHAHTGFVATQSSSNLPYAIEPIDDRSGSLIQSGNEAYDLRCYDSGLELKNRIRIFVREWNTLEDFLLYGTSSGTDGSADVSGTEGVNCDYNGLISGNCNDHGDWGDLLNRAGGAYDTSDIVNRSQFFPRDREWQWRSR